MPEKRLYTLAEALSRFVTSTTTQDAQHIKPLHWYVACALVVEGGFSPESITPRPPFRISLERRGRDVRHVLFCDDAAALDGERTLLGGLKTKAVDVVVSTSHVGPCLAVSLKGSLNAFRNLTNRMEEAVGDCTNLHISYPALVYGFLHVLRGTHESEARSPNDVAIRLDGSPALDIVRYHDTLSRLCGRLDVRNEITRYESVAIAIAESTPELHGTVRNDYPGPDSGLRLDHFFATLYRVYDLRFVYSAPRLKRVTKRLEWSPDSPALQMPELAGFTPRIR
jgi:hypothetical protein